MKHKTSVCRCVERGAYQKAQQAQMDLLASPDLVDEDQLVCRVGMDLVGRAPLFLQLLFHISAHKSLCH